MDEFNYYSKLIEQIRKAIKNAKAIDSGPNKGKVVDVRIAWEKTVKLFYEVQDITVFEGCKNIGLHDLMIDESFANAFSEEELKDMHELRMRCNVIVHGVKEIERKELDDLIESGERNIHYVEEFTGINILENDKELPPCEKPDLNVKDIVTKKKANRNSSVPDKLEDRRKLLMRLLKEEVDNNGNPFDIICENDNCANINKKEVDIDLHLSIDWVLRDKIARVGIYIRDDRQTGYFKRLSEKKREIEHSFNHDIIWQAEGTKSPNTRRIITLVHFKGNSIEEYERVVERCVVIANDYVKLCNKYLPEVFLSNNRDNSGKVNTVVKKQQKLVANKSYGRRAQDIYDKCCADFGWKSSRRGCFGPQAHLFAKTVTPEKYDVWFICHSNLTKTNKGKWKNFILVNQITEVWNESAPEINKGERVVFAKNEGGEYCFLGIYKFAEFISKGQKAKVRYKKITDKYPR